ncbi:MAG: efflux RND transporter permease subunit, partial [Candidatus Peregrinibacteria bacterium]|nr:efflux RND transporter permease subunit [Candidatus Peregrinibacteria bacterium]
VDATIVMMEGIHENIYGQKMSPVNAALKTVKTFRYSLLSGMLTTIAAFVPMFMMSGMMGQFFKYIPTTVNTVLISSFIIGLFFIPAYAVLFMHKLGSHEKEPKFIKAARMKREHFISKVNAKYRKLLHYLLGERKRRVGLFWISMAAFVSALALPFVGLVKVEGFPLVDLDFMFINAEAPVGFTLDKLDPIARKIEEVVLADENIESYVINLGSGGDGAVRGDLGPTSTNTHLASMTINFVDKEDRTIKSYDIAEGYKDKLSFITEAEITVPELRSGPPTGKAIQVRVFGEDFSVLQEISNNIKPQLEAFGGAQVDDDIATSTAEFTFDFTSPYVKTVLKNQGLSVMDVAQEVRMAVYPSKVASIKRGDEEIDIDIQRDWGGYKPASIDAVKQVQIQNMQGDYITLGTITQPKIGASLTSISHYGGEQAITVSADVASGMVPGDVLSRLEPFLASYEWPKGYRYELAGGNEETMQSFKDLFNAMFIGILLIFLILITQFNSFKQPFVILMSLPLSLIGVLYGFMIFRLNVGVATMIGIVALSGIVINDAIILIDRINQNRREKKMKLEEAIIEAGPARLQPILITSITTVLGILPISLTDPFWLTLGMAIAFGMAFSTILTLIIIPVFYYSTELKAERAAMHGHHRT